MIRFAISQARGRPRIVQVEGRLDAESTRALCDLVGPSPQTTTIDLAGLTSLDAEGRRALRALHRAGCQFRGASVYIAQALQETGGRTGDDPAHGAIRPAPAPDGPSA